MEMEISFRISFKDLINANTKISLDSDDILGSRVERDPKMSSESKSSDKNGGPLDGYFVDVV